MHRCWLIYTINLHCNLYIWCSIRLTSSFSERKQKQSFSHRKHRRLYLVRWLGKKHWPKTSCFYKTFYFISYNSFFLILLYKWFILKSITPWLSFLLTFTPRKYLYRRKKQELINLIYGSKLPRNTRSVTVEYE